MTTPSEPALSVVIPAYNAEQFIREALNSVLAQGIADMEVIVVEDESADRTGVVVQSFGDAVRFVRRQSSGGFPGAVRDAGIAVSRAPLIAFLDADDLMLPGRLQSQMRLFEENPELGLAFTDYQNFSDEGEEAPHFRSCRMLSQKLVGRETLILDSAAATKLLLRENFGMPSTAMMRRDVLRRVPGFMDTLSTSEDFVFFYRIAREFKVAAIGRVGAKRRVHGSNTTGNSLKVLQNYVSSRRLLLEEETRNSNREDLKRIVADREIDLAREYGNRRWYFGSMILAGSAFARSATIPFLGGMGRSVRVALRTLSIALRLRGPGP